MIILAIIGSFLKPAQALNILPCYLDPNEQHKRSQEIHQLYLADQKDRENVEDMSDEERAAMRERDLTRRKRLGEIFAEGCIKKASDYYDAAMIFQHGEVADHFFQAFYFASKASLEDYNGAKWLKAAAIDRYLISIGHQQLFATQFYASQQTNWYLCLQPVELSFPGDRRLEATGKSIENMFAMIDELNRSNGRGCPQDYCQTNLKHTPKGTIPGFW